MQAGELKDWIQIQQKTTTFNASREKVNNWTEFYSCPAKVQTLSSSELQKAGKTDKLNRYKIKIRMYPGITSHMRVIWYDYDNDTQRTLEITGSANDQTNKKFTFIFATETA